MKTKAVRLYGVNDLRLDEFELPKIKDDEVLAAVKQAIDENPKAVEDYLAGQKASINFLVGQVMRITRGKADPGETVKLLKENIE